MLGLVVVVVDDRRHRRASHGLRHAGQAHVVVGQSDRQAVGAPPRGRAATEVVEVQQLRGRAGVVQARAVAEEQRGVLPQPECRVRVRDRYGTTPRAVVRATPRRAG